MSGVTEYSDEHARPDKSDGEESSGLSARLPKISGGGRLGKFYHDVKTELVKTTWPARSQVWSTTVVVIIAVVFFGFYLWGCDKLFGAFFNFLEKTVK